MKYNAPSIIVPVEITDAMIVTGTSIAEPDTDSGEVAWVSAASFTLGQRCIRSTTHRIYECVQAHSARTELPEDDPTYWLDVAPTNRYAPFDLYVSTPATAEESITFVLQPGFFNAVSMYGLLGSDISVVVKDAPGGTVIFKYEASLFAQASGLWELLFTPLRQINRLVLKDILISPTAELTITVAGGADQEVAIGMINVGDYRSLIGDATFGGTEQGASAEPKTFSSIKVAEDGTTRIKRRGFATDMRGSIVLPAEVASESVDLTQSLLDIPVSVIASGAPGSDYLNVFGLLSGSMKADKYATARLDFSVKGFI